MNFFSKILYVYPNFFKLRTAIYCLLLILAVLFELISIGIILPVVSSIISAEAKILNFDFIPYFEILSNFTQLDLVTSVLFLLFLVFVFKTLFFLYLAWFEQSYLEKISNSLSSYFFEKYLKLDYSIHLKKSSPELIRNVTTEVQIFVRNVILPILYIITDFLILIGIIFLIVLVEPKGSIYLSIIYMLFGLIFILGFKKKLSDLALSRQIYDQKRIKSYINAFHGIKTIKIFNKEIQFLGDFVNYNSALNRIGKLTGFIVKIPKQMIELITISSFILLTIILLSKESDVLAIFPKLAIFVAAAFRLIPSMNRFLHHYQAIKIGHPSVNKLYDERILLEKKISHQKDTNSIGDFNEIKFNDISFSFNSEKKILKNLNFLIKKGENIGIIGKTGEGKTTLLDIILGLLKPTKGEVFINGISLKQVISQWRMRIGYVPQSTFLLDESIKNNITLEFDKNKVNEKNLEYAINYSQVSEFSKTLVNGINTVIGDRGVRISGGQQQRIGIARALYKNPDLLVLDESTSSLDIKTEEQIINDVLKLKNTKTLVIVSHRNSTIQKCNKIYELKEMNLVKIK